MFDPLSDEELSKMDYQSLKTEITNRVYDVGLIFERLEHLGRVCVNGHHMARTLATTAEKLFQAHYSRVYESHRKADETVDFLRDKFDAIAKEVGEKPAAAPQSNFRWLLERMDEVHAQLCPNKTGSWQQRAEQVVEAAEHKWHDKVREGRMKELIRRYPEEARRYIGKYVAISKDFHVLAGGDDVGKVALSLLDLKASSDDPELNTSPIPAP